MLINYLTILDLLFKYIFIIASINIIKNELINKKRKLPDIIVTSPFNIFCKKFLKPISLIFPAATPLATKGESEIIILKIKEGKNLFQVIFVSPIA